MKQNKEHLKEFRYAHPMRPELNDMGDNDNGCLVIQSPISSRGNMFVIFSNGGGWDHVSVSLYSKKLPTWVEMCFVKDLLFEEDETVIQFHPKKSEYVDNYPCLHLWKLQGKEFPIPHHLMVGIK